MKNMSFMHTKQQIRDRTKTETTRAGWWKSRPGEVVMACDQCRGIPKGCHIVRIIPIRFVKLERIYVRVENYSQENVTAEGFPELEPAEFVLQILIMKCGVKYFQPVNRIVFEYVG